MTKTRLLLLAAPPEWVVLAALLAVAVLVQWMLRAPVEWSSVGPILGHIGEVAAGYVFVAVWLWLALRAGKSRVGRLAMARRLGTQVSDAFCLQLS